MWKLVRYLKNFKKEITVGPFFKLLEAILELTVPVVMASIIDVGVVNRDSAYIYKMGGVMLLLGAVGLAFAVICQYSAAVASQGVGTDLRNDLFSHINTLSYKELDQLGTNSLITRITNDVNQVQLAVAMLIRLAIRAPFIIIGATVMAMLIDIKMSMIFLLMIPAIAVILYLVMSRSVPFYRVRQSRLDRVSLVTRENLDGVRVIRAFSRQDHENRRFVEASKEVTDTAVKVGNIAALLNPATFAVLNAGIVAIIWFGGLQVNVGNLTQGQIIALVSYTTQISLTLIVVANVVVILTKASASARRIQDVFDTKPSILPGHIKEINPQKDKIQFRNVFFSYNNNKEYALESINLEVKAGETVGIIGGTGAGKSTLINLMPRFYDIQKGSLKVDGVDVKEYEFDALRSKFGIVPQQSLLFEGTIEDNLRWGNEDASAEVIEKALDIAQAKEIVEQKEDKLDTLVVKGGKNLSGGQKQRIAIARALVKEPEILILDDSSSALDYLTESKLRMKLKESSSRLTVFIVSQRVSSIKHADKIVVLDEGKIVGEGKHEELFESCQTYREICLSQMKQEEVYGA